MENQNNICNICGCQGGFARLVMGALAVALVAYVAALAVNSIKENKYIGRATQIQSTISVSGEGEVYKTPDLAVMNFSVVSEAKTVAEAMEDNTKKMNAIIDVTKSLGVEEKDLQTTNYRINPRYDYVKTTSSILRPTTAELVIEDEEYYYPSGKRVLSGYDVTQTLTVKVREENMEKIGTIINEVAAAGANQVGDLQFTLDDPDAAQAEAREKAIEEAKSKAGKLAEQLGVKLVRIINYNDSRYYPVSQINYAAKDMAAGMGGAAESAPTIQTGENKITVSVNISYEIE